MCASGWERASNNYVPYGTMVGKGLNNFIFILFELLAFTH